VTRILAPTHPVGQLARHVGRAALRALCERTLTMLDRAEENE
jgi:hypothetical protein